jgi:TIR domain
MSNQIQLEKVKTLAGNWFKPRLDELRTAFPRIVQSKLGEFSQRGLAYSSPTYAAVENLAFREIEQRGRTILEGYEQALNAVFGLIGPVVVAEIKRDLNLSLETESVQVHAAIQYVREACKPSKVKDAAELRIRTLQKLNGELDLLCAKLNTERGQPTLGWKPTSSKFTNFRVYEQGQLASPDVLELLIQHLFLEPETEIKYYYQDGTDIDGPLVQAIHNGHILMRKSELRFFRHPEIAHSYIKIEKDDNGEPWQKQATEQTPEFVEVTLQLSARKRAELDTINKVQLEEQIREQLKRQKWSFDVFLSYSERDKESAALIHTKVSASGGRIFMAPKEMSPGDDFAEKIRNALVHSRELWLLVSPRSITSEWVISEWGAAWALEKKIVPILYQCDQTALPERLRRIHSVDLHLIDDLIAKTFPKKQ